MARAKAKAKAKAAPKATFKRAAPFKPTAAIQASANARTEPFIVPKVLENRWFLVMMDGQKYVEVQVGEDNFKDSQLFEQCISLRKSQFRFANAYLHKFASCSFVTTVTGVESFKCSSTASLCACVNSISALSAEHKNLICQMMPGRKKNTTFKASHSNP